MNDTLAADFKTAQSKLVVQTADLPLGTLADMVESGGIDLRPGFQRRERWNADKQSALIESFLMNVPVPPIYLAEEDDGTYTAIDGKQRLKALTEFIYDRLALRNLESLSSADGLVFSRMPSEIINAFRLRPFLRVVTLLKQTDPLLKYEVFLRLNRGGEKLNAQEIRNVAYRGPLNDLIYELSNNGFLRSRLKITNEKSGAYRDMQDAEYVLRFFTLMNSLYAFSGDLSREMDAYMRDNRDASPAVISNLRSTFERAISRVEQIWGDNAFKRPEGSGWRDQALAGMFDAQMLAVTLAEDNVFAEALNRRDSIVAKTRDLFSDAEFDKAVRTGTNTPARIITRVEEMLHTLMPAE